MKRKKKIEEISSLDEVPKFKSEDEERKFWETHSLSDGLADILHDPKAEKEFLKIQRNLRLTDRRR